MWWCHGTIYGTDESFEESTAARAQKKMSDYLTSKKIDPSAVKWEELKRYRVTPPNLAT